MKAAKARREGKFKNEIIPVEVKKHKQTVIFDQDETIREDTTIETLSKLKPAFKENGTVTAGNSSGINDCAAAVVVMSKEKAEEMGKKPIAVFRGFSSAGVDPSIMGYAPVPAINKLLKKTGVRKEDIDLFEINEAFAAQAAACVRDLGLDPEKVNVNGGAIALGHPVGCSGARLVVTVVNEMIRRNAKYAVVALCIGGGQGIASLIERC